jgi:hypothetical protein
MGRSRWDEAAVVILGHTSLPVVASSGPIRLGRWTAEGGCPHMGVWLSQNFNPSSADVCLRR